MELLVRCKKLQIILIYGSFNKSKKPLNNKKKFKDKKNTYKEKRPSLNMKN